MKSKPDPLLKTQPWRVLAVFLPLEKIIDRIAIDGTVQVAGRQVVFKEAAYGKEWYDAVEALRGIIDFHRMANEKYPVKADYAALEKLVNRLDAGAMIFDSDLPAIRASINSCKRQALSLRVSQAASLVQDVQISVQFDKLKRDAA